MRHVRSPVCGTVIDHDGLVNKFGKPAKHFLDALLLIQAGDDDCNTLTFIQVEPTIVRVKIKFSGGSSNRLCERLIS